MDASFGPSVADAVEDSVPPPTQAESTADEFTEPLSEPPVPMEPATTDDEPTDGADSAFGEGSDMSGYATSLKSEVRNFKYENGRTYHSYKEGQYVLPNDESEQDRQDLLHHVRNLTLGGALFRAPIPTSPQRVLDVGTGTGIWAIDFAD